MKFIQNFFSIWDLCELIHYENTACRALLVGGLDGEGED